MQPDQNTEKVSVKKGMQSDLVESGKVIEMFRCLTRKTVVYILLVTETIINDGFSYSENV
jgi:hypothetical protein